MSKLGLFIFYNLAKFLSRINKKNIINHRINIEHGEGKYMEWRDKVNLGKLKNFYPSSSEINFKNKTILDFGCGTGGLCKIISEYKPKKVIGIDLSSDSIKIAKTRNFAENVVYKKGSINKIPIQSKTIDYIFCFDVLEHIMDIHSIFSEFMRILKDKGRLFIEWAGWYAPFSAHLFNIVPIPWVQIFFTEKTIFQGFTKIYESNWYIPRYRDIDKETGHKKANPWKNIKSFNKDLDLNKMTISQFKNLLKKYNNIKILEWKKSVGSNKYFKWLKIFARLPIFEEYFTIYNMIVLEKI